MNNIIIFMTLLTLPILLQILLSRSENKRLGLVLPTISFVFSILMVMNLAHFEDMQIIDIIVISLSTLFLSNIPTFVFTGIYLITKETMKRDSRINTDLDKMNIKDL